VVSLRKAIALIATMSGLTLWQASIAAGREQIHAVGSSTVYPFTKEVAARVAKAAAAPTPLVEMTSTGAGIAAFCKGVGASHPDIASASRRMTKSEFEACGRNGVKDIVEIPIGLDGEAIVRSRTGPSLKLTLAQLFLALAKETPGAGGRLVANPHRKWSDIDPSLPAVDIAVLGPSQGHGTRDSLHEHLLNKGAQSIPALAELKRRDEKAFERLWKTLRTDGVYVEAGEGYQATFHAMLAAKRTQLVVVGYSSFQGAKDKVAAVAIDGVDPSYDAIADGKYAGARKLYIYIKKAQIGVVPALDRIGREFMSADALGADGYLLKTGFVPLGPADFIQTLSIVESMPPLGTGALKD